MISCHVCSSGSRFCQDWASENHYRRKKFRLPTIVVGHFKFQPNEDGGQRSPRRWKRILAPFISLMNPSSLHAYLHTQVNLKQPLFLVSKWSHKAYVFFSWYPNTSNVEPLPCPPLAPHQSSVGRWLPQQNWQTNKGSMQHHHQHQYSVAAPGARPQDPKASSATERCELQNR